MNYFQRKEAKDFLTHEVGGMLREDLSAPTVFSVSSVLSLAVPGSCRSKGSFDLE